MNRRVIPNSDVLGVTMEIPAGHRHLRTVIRFRDGSELEFQEATLAALVRAFVRVKTDPRRTRMVLAGREMDDRREGFASWQLVEED